MQFVSRNIAVLVPILYIQFITNNKHRQNNEHRQTNEHRQNKHTTATCVANISSLFV